MAVAALAVQYNLAVLNQAQATLVFPEPDNAPPAATLQASWDAVLRLQRHALHVTAGVNAITPLAVQANLVQLLGPLATAQLQLQHLVVRLQAVTGAPDGAAGTAMTAHAATLSPAQFKTDIGNNSRRLAIRFTAALLQALIAAAQPPPPAPAPPQQQQVNIVPTFVGKIPEFSGAEANEFRQWRIRVTNLVTGQLNALTTDRVLGLKVQEGLSGAAAIAANTRLPQPQPGTPNDDASKTAYLEAIMDWLRDAFGNPNEVMEAGKAYNNLRQKDLAFGQFFVQYQDLRELAGLANDPAAMANDLRGKISPALRASPFVATENRWDELVAACRLWDPVVRAAAAKKEGRTAATTPAQTSRSRTSTAAPAATMQNPRSTYETIHRARRFEWPADIPVECRGRMTNELRELLEDQNRCFFCRRVGHESWECPEKEGNPELQGRPAAPSRGATPAPLDEIRAQGRRQPPRNPQGRFRAQSPEAGNAATSWPSAPTRSATPAASLVNYDSDC